MEEKPPHCNVSASVRVSINQTPFILPVLCKQICLCVFGKSWQKWIYPSNRHTWEKRSKKGPQHIEACPGGLDSGVCVCVCESNWKETHRSNISGVTFGATLPVLFNVSSLSRVITSVSVFGSQLLSLLLLLMLLSCSLYFIRSISTSTTWVGSLLG